MSSNKTLCFLGMMSRGCMRKGRRWMNKCDYVQMLAGGNEDRNQRGSAEQ